MLWGNKIGWDFDRYVLYLQFWYPAESENELSSQAAVITVVMGRKIEIDLPYADIFER